MFTGSGINSAIIKGVSSMVAGDQQGTMQGLDVVDKDELDGSLKEQYLLLNKLLKRGNRNTIKNLSFDLKLFGSCYINVIWNKTKTAIAEIKHIPAQYIRSGKVNSFGEVTEYHYSFDWANTSQNKPRVIKAFNPDDRTESSQLMQVKEYNPQSFYYGIPDYIGGTDYIRLDMSIAELHLANVDNNFFGSAMISFNNGIPTDEERQEVEQKINQKFSGSGNSGKLVITFNDGKETAPEITPLNTGDNDDKYQFLSSEVSRKILTAHRITSPLLFGIKSDGGFGSNNADELRDAYSLLNSIVIKPLQSTLLESLDTIFRINGIVDLSIYFKTLQPADFINLDEVDAIDEQDAGVDIGEISEDMPTEETEENIEPSNDVVESDEIEIVQDVEASYNGAQISSAIDIVAKVQEGILTKEQAIVFLIQFLQLPPEVAQRFFTDTEVSTKPMVENLKDILRNLKKKKISNSVAQFKSENESPVSLEYFDKIGFTLDKDEWFEAHVETIDDNQVDKNYHEFAYAPAGTPNAISKASDIGMFRLLYRYSQTLSINNKTGKVSSREFCQKMVAKSVAGTLYNLEDLEKASTKSVNKGFGAGGSNTYSIQLYCGGANCRHKWERVWYFRRQVPKGQTFVGDNGEIYTEGEYLPNGTLNNFKLVSQQFANGKVPMPDDKQMRTPSWNQKNHGFIKPRKEKQRSSNTKVG